MSHPSGNTARGLADPAQPALSAVGLSMAALIMTVFGFVWLGWGFSVSKAFTDFFSDKSLPAARWISFYVVSLLLFGISFRALHRGNTRMKALAAAPDDFRSRFGKRFRVILFYEGTGCVVAVFFVGVFHRWDLLAAGISLIVGLHFLPLARLFMFPAYYVAGVAIIVCDLLSAAFMRAEAITLMVGVATGAVLWFTAIYALLLCNKFLREVAAH